MFLLYLNINYRRAIVARQRLWSYWLCLAKDSVFIYLLSVLQWRSNRSIRIIFL